jgi:Tol biopolymer transport system component
MLTDGNDQILITNDTCSNWFPHPSLNSDVIVFLAYLEDLAHEHPTMKKVALRLYDIKSKKTKTLFKCKGDHEGTINVSSWSPDEKNLLLYLISIVIIRNK